jgi:CheY-like chemotaxis protein
MSEQVRIVVGEGRAMRRGLLRFVLEGEGYQVVAEATTAAELGRVLAVHRPDLVVLDDGIGAMAVGMTREMVPDAKIILVWPRAVVPVGGDARVDPSDVLRELGPAVARVATPASEKGLTAVPPLAERPPWIERVRKDRSALRERLAKATPPPSERPNVTRLQRRGQRLHPLSRKPGTEEEQPTEGTGSDQPIIDDSGPAPVVILPSGEPKAPQEPEEQREDEAAAGAVAAAAAAGTEAAAGEGAEKEAKEGAGASKGAAVAAAAAAGAVAAGKAARSRRIGAVVLTGAAATAAITLALVLGENRQPTNLSALPTAPSSAPTTPGNGGTVGPTTPPPSNGGHNGGHKDGNKGGGPGGNGDNHDGNGKYPPVPRYARAYIFGRR